MRTTASYIGQVERDPEGALWAVLYHGDQVITRDPVRSLRRGKRRVADLVLAAADTCASGPQRPVPIPLNRVPQERVSSGRHRRASVA